jgi:hypothetical protein
MFVSQGALPVGEEGSSETPMGGMPRVIEPEKRGARSAQALSAAQTH